MLNLVRRRSPTQIDLEEFKPHYHATFSNVFQPGARGTLYTLTAHVRLNGPYRVLAPLVKPFVVSRMRRFVLEPMKTAAEQGKGNAA